MGFTIFANLAHRITITLIYTGHVVLRCNICFSIEMLSHVAEQMVLLHYLIPKQPKRATTSYPEVHCRAKTRMNRRGLSFSEEVNVKWLYCRSGLDINFYT